MNASRVLAGIGGLGILLIGAIGYTALGPAGGAAKAPYLIEIEKGTRPQKIAAALEAQGIVASADRFWLVGKLLGYWSKIKAGEYEVSAQMSYVQILRTLASGVSKSVAVTIQEGANMYQVAEILVGKGFGNRSDWLRLFKDRALLAELGLPPAALTAEGYLYPETYGFTRRTEPQEIVKSMTTLALRAWTPELETKSRALGLDHHRTVTLASVIEKETGAAEERPMISSVFHNRLRKKMRLQSDPTTIYGIWERFDGNLHRKDLTEHTPYNTYAIPALPVGPICNPGREALLAAVSPITSPHLYFVSKNDGTHAFTSEFKDHQREVARFQLDRKAREGKSWRDLKTRTAK